MVRNFYSKRFGAACVIAAAMSGAAFAGDALPGAQTINEPAYQQFLFAYRLMQRGEDQLAVNAFDEYLGQFPGDSRQGDALYFRAALARKTGDLKTAATILEKIPAPVGVPFYAPPLLRGQILAELGQHEAAIAALESIDQTKLEPLVRATVLLLQGQTYRNTRNLDGSILHLNQAAELDTPLRARALLELGRSQWAANQRDAALESLNKSLVFHDREISAATALLAGDMASAQKQTAKAADFYKKIIAEYQSAPEFSPAVVGLLWTQWGSKQYETLVATAQQFQASLTPQARVVALYLSGSSFIELRRFDQAITAMQTALPLSEQSAWHEKILYKSAVAFFELGKDAQMSQQLNELQRQHPQSPLNIDGQFLLAASDARRGDDARGTARLTAIIDQGNKNPYFAPALLQRAKLYETSHLLSPAAADFQNFLAAVNTTTQPAATGQIDARANVPAATLRLMDLYCQLEKPAQADALATNLMQDKNLDPLLQQEALYRQARARIQSNRLEAALESINALLVKYPQSIYLDQARYDRGLLLLTLGKPTEALSDLDQSGQATKIPANQRGNALRLAAWQLREAGDVNASAKRLLMMEKLCGLDALPIEDRLWLAGYLVDTNLPREALRYVEPLTQMKPTATQPVNERIKTWALFVGGRALRSLDQKSAALDAFRQVIAMGEGFEMQARLEMAGTLRDLGRKDEALSEYAGLISAQTSLIAASALYESALIHRGFFLELQSNDGAKALRENREARKLFKRLVLLYSFDQLSPLPELSHLYCAQIATEMLEPTDVESELAEVMKKYPQSVYADFARAMQAAQTKRRGDARFLYEKLREKALDPRLAKMVQEQLHALELMP